MYPLQEKKIKKKGVCYKNTLKEKNEIHLLNFLTKRQSYRVRNLPLTGSRARGLQQQAGAGPG